MSSSTTALLQAKWLITSCRVQVAFQRLRLSLRAYHADQPRVPAGHPDGGQWTDGGAGDGYDSGDDARIVHVSDDLNRRYTVVLSEEEVRGGHTLREHVGKTDAQMMQRVQSSKRRFLFVDYGLRRDGKFDSVETGNDLINCTLEQNASEVDDVAIGKKANAFLKSRFGYKTGREAYTAGQLELYMRTTYGVGIFILHDPGNPRGSASIPPIRATTEIDMRASPEFLKFGRWFMQDIGGGAPTLDEMYDFVLNLFRGEERVRLRQFIDRALREASDETLKGL